MLTAAFLASQPAFRPEFKVSSYIEHSEIQPIDAPENMAAGSHEHYDYVTTDGWAVLPTAFSRAE